MDFTTQKDDTISNEVEDLTDPNGYEMEVDCGEAPNIDPENTFELKNVATVGMLMNELEEYEDLENVAVVDMFETN
jgi:hypothetical protein